VQSDPVDSFDDSVGAINVPDTRTKNGAGQVCSAAPAKDRRNSRSAEGKWVVFATHWTSVFERALVNMTTEQGREGPIPTNVHIRL
jgi:hypothetical protein